MSPRYGLPVLGFVAVLRDRLADHAAQAMIHERERSGSAWVLEWMTWPAMAEATGAALRHANRLIASIKRIGRQDTV